MALGEAPAVEDEVVLCDLREGGLERAAGCGREDDVVECAARRDGLDGAAGGEAEEAGEGDRRHGSTVTAGWG